MSERDIFIAALQKENTAERTAYLDQACASDMAMRQRIELLLQAHDNAGSFLDRPAAVGAATGEYTPSPEKPSSAASAVGEKPGDRIGSYKLLQQIGEGGMGIVWMAEQQEPVRRLVAVKVIKAGMDSSQVVARFQAERQALALMDHPNIAKVLDAGTTNTGRLFFAMELVKGTPLTKYCDEHRLTPQQRLELFVPVCQALQHAHQKGIIHRDIKPSNVLVAPYDGKPVVKVIDFGVAKATGQRLTDKTTFTEFGAVIGTLEYMSPEQAELNNQDIDTRSDIYSLGVLLYELLTGTTPLDRARLKTAAFTEMLRIIREEEPPKPSTRLTDSKDALPSISAQRQMEPAKLARLMRGELDWIVMKALEKDRGRRYETANGLARDIERYLQEEPVEACPPSAGYRLRKFARKYRAPLRVAVAFLVFLLVGAVFSAWQAVRATRAEDAATGERDRAVEALDETKKAREQTAQALKESQDYAARLREEKLASERLRYISDMRLVPHAWEQNAPLRLRELLALHRPQRLDDIDLRGFEWYYWDRVGNSELHNLKGHANEVHSVAFSPDGRRLASASSDKTVKIWDTGTGQELLTFKGHAASVSAVAFGPDGRLASASGDKTVKIWDPRTGQELLTLKGHARGVNSVAFSPDGRRVASGSADKTVKIWDAATGQELLTLEGHAASVSAVAFGPDGRLASGSSDTNVKIWDANTGKELLNLKGNGNTRMGLAFSPDGLRLAFAGERGVKIWDLGKGQELLTLDAGLLAYNSLAFSPDGQRLASGWMDNTVKIWDSNTGQKLATFLGHSKIVDSVAFSPDGRWLASASWDKTVKIWNHLDTNPAMASLKGHTGPVHSVVFSPDGRRLASGSLDKTIRIWDPSTGQELRILKGHTKNVPSVAFSPDGRRLASASSDNTVKIWDPGTGQVLSTLKGHAKEVTSVAFSPDGRRLASASYDQTIKIWDLGKDQDLLTLKGHTKNVYSVAFSPDGRRLASGSLDNTVKIWDPGTGQVLFTLKGHTRVVKSVAFSPDGRRVASASYDTSIKIWDPDTGRELLSLKGHTNDIIGVVFSPDGRRLASASVDNTVKVWDLATGQELLTLKGPTSKVLSVAFSPDGRRLAAGYTDRSIAIWDATPRDEAKAFVPVPKTGRR